MANNFLTLTSDLSKPFVIPEISPVTGAKDTKKAAQLASVDMGRSDSSLSFLSQHDESSRRSSSVFSSDVDVSVAV